MTNTLVDSIKSALESGKTKEQIFKIQLTNGSSVDEINRAFSIIESQTSPEDAQKRTINYIVLGGAILVGAGMFSFIASNWQLLPSEVKVLVILMGMSAAYGLGWWFREARDYVKTGNALLLLGNLIYGGGIFLVGQIFHISANWPDGFILWLIGSIVMGLAINSLLIVTVGVIVGMVSVIGYPIVLLESIAGHQTTLVTSVFILLLASISTIGGGWIIRRNLFDNEMEEVY
ncbi:DUF2157 domain-containing protein [candidate division WWE3 bacterium]|nr:DUF2157 domain-containing protein [candidate division WWE3 bacterium]